jgi:hypothetical protein
MAKNVWKKLEPKLREVFPYPWEEGIEEEDKEWQYDSSLDPLLPFLVGDGAESVSSLNGEIEFVELAGSIYDGMDYDSIPQGTEDECSTIIKIDDTFYRVGLIFTSYSGYKLDNVAHAVSPKTIEVVIYE